jgi:hypothetical protein
MYENITYSELKGMSDEQKKEVLTEMLNVYKTPREIATKLNIAPVAIINLIRRLIDGKPVGRVKKEEVNVVEIKDQVKSDAIIENATIPIKRKYTKKQKVIVLPEEIKSEPKFDAVTIKTKELKIISTNTIEGTISGNELIQRLEGLAKAILENKEYTVNIKTEEN